VPAFSLFARLTKIRIASASALSAATAFLVFDPRPQLVLVGGVAAILLLAAGASALNEWQERDLDARMARTRRRPLPAGEIGANTALAAALGLLAMGLIALLGAGGLVSALLGLATVGWYNGVYTPLKRVTAFAAVPGGLVGVGAPAIGWSMAGGRLDDPRLAALAFFFFLWQVPHFWLLLLRHGEEYAQAGLPSLPRLLGRPALARLTFAWLVATACAAPLLSLFGLTRSPWTALALAVLALMVVTFGARWLMGESERRAGPAFRGINVFACLVMVLLVVDAGCSGPRTVRLGQGAIRRSASPYQMPTRWLSGRHMGSPGTTPKAS
jgi:heme o synthase